MAKNLGLRSAAKNKKADTEKESTKKPRFVQAVGVFGHHKSLDFIRVIRIIKVKKMSLYASKKM